MFDPFRDDTFKRAFNRAVKDSNEFWGAQSHSARDGLDSNENDEVLNSLHARERVSQKVRILFGYLY